MDDGHLGYRKKLIKKTVVQPFSKWQNFAKKRSKKWKKIENEVISEGVHGQKWKKKK